VGAGLVAVSERAVRIVSEPGYFVFGVEGSGTRMLTDMVIGCGAIGSAGHGQAHDSELPKAGSVNNPIVWRRSFPHARQTPSVAILAGKMREAGWDPYALVIVRDTLANTYGQVTAHAPTVRAAWEKNQSEFAAMFNGLTIAQVPYDVLTYENIVARPIDTQDYLAQLPGLRRPDKYKTIRDANDKHYQAWRADLARATVE